MSKGEVVGTVVPVLVGLGIMAGQGFQINFWVLFFWAVAVVVLVFSITHRDSGNAEMPRVGDGLPSTKTAQPDSTLSMLAERGARISFPRGGDGAGAERRKARIHVKGARRSAVGRDELLVNVENDGLVSGDFCARAVVKSKNYESERVYLPWAGAGDQPEVSIRAHDYEQIHLGWATTYNRERDWFVHLEIEHIGTGPSAALLVKLNGRGGPLATFEIDIVSEILTLPRRVVATVIINAESKCADVEIV